jgi:3-phosphoshikimate 1-carboxyvinyltransferase
MLQGQGADIQDQDGVITFEHETFTLKPLNFTVPGDMSAAAFLMTAALIVPDGEIILQSVNTNPTRTGLLETLQQMGGQIQIDSEKRQAGEPVAGGAKLWFG